MNEVSQPPHGGALAVAAARRYGVTTMFTLSGGHVFPLYDGAVKADPPLRLVDVRHEQTAVFAAEGTARLTRTPGLAVLTAGPGVTNGVSAITTAYFNSSAVVVLAGRAPDYRWGSGSLQELDHPQLVVPVTKRAWTEHDTKRIAAAVDEAFRLATAPHRGPVFLDIAVEALFGPAEAPAGQAASPHEAASAREAVPEREAAPGREAGSAGRIDTGAVDRIAALLAAAQRPVLVLGSDVWLGGAETQARLAAEELRLPVITNGQGRGILPAGHELLVTRARSTALREADLVLVAGAPLDFRLGYGEFGGQGDSAPARVVHVTDAPDQVATHCPLAASAAGDLAAFFTGLAGSRAAGPTAPDWLARLRDAVRAATEADRDLLASQAAPFTPCGCTANSTGCWTTMRRSSAMAEISSPTRGSTSSRAAQAGGSIPARTDAWAPGSATPSRPGWPGRPRRWPCSSVTARPDSR